MEKRVLRQTFILKWSHRTGFALCNSENKALQKVSCEYNLNALLCFGNEGSAKEISFTIIALLKGPVVGLANYNIFKNITKY